MADSGTDRVEAALDRLTSRIEDLLQHVTPSPSPPFPSRNPVPAQTHRLKLDVPRFDGTDPMGWIFKITQFFEYHGTPNQDRITIAAFYMEGRALAWFQWMSSNGQFTSWPVFLQALQTRFSPSNYEDPSGSLFKLTQRTTVTEYLSEFEELANRVVGLPAPFLLSCFVSGLAPEIRREVMINQPLTVAQAAGLARLHEEKLRDLRFDFRHPNRPRTPQPPPIVSQHPPPLSSFPSPRAPSLPPLLPLPPRTNPPPPPTFRRLTPEELASRRERGLCFSCDEKFHKGHRCAPRVHLLIADAEDPVEHMGSNIDPSDPIDPGPGPMEIPDSPAHISLNSLAGHLAPETLRLVGDISGIPVLVLIDGGSTHNFLQEQLVVQLGLTSHPTSPLKVMVGNGQHLQCHTICDSVTLILQQHSFTVDFYVLPIAGANVILGVQWLQSLGPILTDYTHLSMQFFHDGRLVNLQGDPEAHRGLLSSPQFRRACRNQNQSLCFHITMLPNDLDSPLTRPVDPQVQHLLQQFSILFQEPNALPPARDTDHQIHLRPHATPVNVRPYKYPYYQKREIETQVETMLQRGIIQPSKSPFSSPVLLVKKSDNTWRFCVDYRALNALTIKDRFPIPTIDELLDELGDASCFSKLDLLQGYHQIRMQPDDIPKTAFRTHHGHFEFKVMPFGLCNAPSSFQATMNTLFRPYLRRFIIVFFDDILIYSVSLSDHLRHLQTTFQVLYENHFVLKLSKCLFAQPEVEYLGHLVSYKGVQPVTAKLDAIAQWPQPRTVRALRGFLGLAGFYRRFIHGYATIAAPLVKATTVEPLQWTSSTQTAFETLKQALTSAPVLTLPNFQLPFTIETDASAIGMGAVLSQQGHPIAYFSKPFSQKMLRASTYVRELFAITAAVKK
ncbi:uncharacterized protein LOC114405278 [Glycine soja]|uniref:uncharacterized protein LOC114405278 n=1 Tax=Glycine soja TaxID=3848 RepID=UPI00103BE4B5|nr:uncharacterized protein LOC114405278 [Glycine soja]